MGQVLHGSATTTAAVRRAIQHSQESLRRLARRHGINPKTVARWRKRTSTADVPTGPKEAKPTVLSVEQEAVIVTFRHHTLLPLDDCLYVLQASIPNLKRSSLHRCLQRHGISRLLQVEGEKTAKSTFRTYPIGFFHIDTAEVRTEEGKLHLFVGIDRTSKFAFVELHEKATTRVAGDFGAPVDAVMGRHRGPIADLRRGSVQSGGVTCGPGWFGFGHQKDGHGTPCWDGLVAGAEQPVRAGRDRQGHPRGEGRKRARGAGQAPARA